MELINKTRTSEKTTLKFKVLTIKKYISSDKKEEIINIENIESDNPSMLVGNISLFNKDEERKSQIRNSEGFKDNYIITKIITR